MNCTLQRFLQDRQCSFSHDILFLDINIPHFISIKYSQFHVTLCLRNVIISDYVKALHILQVFMESISREKLEERLLHEEIMSIMRNHV